MTFFQSSLILVLFIFAWTDAFPAEEKDFEAADGTQKHKILAEIMEELKDTEEGALQWGEKKTEQVVKIENSPWLPSAGGSKQELVKSQVQYHETEEGDLKPLARVMQAGACDCLADIYDRPNYQGRPLKLSQQNANFFNDFFNDRVESIDLKGRCAWLFYEHTNFVGRTHILASGYYASAPRWGGPGNQISSARALPPKDTVAICLFQHENFRGRMLVLYGSLANLPEVDFNDHISSIIVIGGMWRLFDHTGFTGVSKSFGEGQYPSVHGHNIGDRISSVLLD